MNTTRQSTLKLIGLRILFYVFPVLALVASGKETYEITTLEWVMPIFMCVIGFFLISMFKEDEKNSIRGFYAIIFCLGIVCYSLFSWF